MWRKSVWLKTLRTRGEMKSGFDFQERRMERDRGKELKVKGERDG